ncbi:MAG: hypothetical protein IJX30_07710 [Clostridia bacterium]|nr:hypothetical protein [Clostridia bacterium]
MKKLILLLLCGVFMTLLGACEKGASTESSSSIENNSSVEQSESSSWDDPAVGTDVCWVEYHTDFASHKAFYQEHFGDSYIRVVSLDVDDKDYNATEYTFGDGVKNIATGEVYTKDEEHTYSFYLQHDNNAGVGEFIGYSISGESVVLTGNEEINLQDVTFILLDETTQSRQYDVICSGIKVMSVRLGIGFEAGEDIFETMLQNIRDGLVWL